MANSARTQPRPQGEVIETSNDSVSLDRAQLFFDKNKNIIIGVAVAVVAVVGGFFAYKYLYMAPKEEKAKEKIAFAQTYFAQDSLRQALQGDGQPSHPGFLRIIKDYSGTPTGNVAHYYAGACYLKMGDFKNAIKQLEDFNGKGTEAATAGYGLLGDAYMESGNTKKGIDNYEQAVNANKKDDLMTPYYLMKLGLAREAGNQSDKAVDAYKRIRDEYPNSQQAREIDRYLARLGVME